MRGRTWAAVCGALIGLVLAAPASAQYTPGARSLNDVYLPKLGNGGYDALHYDLAIDYDPVANTMVSTADITMKATKALSEFSLDLRGFNISAVTIDGVAATYARDIDNDKLIVTPASGIDNNRTFHVVIAYNGTPQLIVDPDDSFEGWIRTGEPPAANRSLGAVVMNEPMGAMGWFPSNNHPSDKATYDFHLTAPTAFIPIGNGELASKVDNPNGTSTWNWHMGYPMASYLTTATTGMYDYTPYAGATATGKSGQPLQFYDFLESALPAATKTTNNTARLRQDAIVKFMADSIGAPYPFESHGVVAHRSSAGYALEVQTKSHFSTGSATIGLGTLAHEIAHQWFGDSVGPATWRELWFNEGWATWWATYWSNKQNNNPLTTAQFFTNNYDGFTDANWAVPPAQLQNNTQLFVNAYIYTRPAMMLEAYRQIVGDSAFWAFQKALVTDFAYGTITTEQFIALAKQIAQEKAGFEASNLAKLDQFFQQWLWTPGKPTLTPTTFFQSTSVPGDVSGTVPGTLSLSVGGPASFGAFTPGVARDYTASLAGNVISTAGDATLTVVDPSTNAPGRLVNGAFALAQPVHSRIGAADFAPISGSPLTLKSYTGPVSNDPLTIDLRQSIGSAEPLRTGTYSKTLTFTLSTTSP
jgi:aminopeptidase N